jgi:hypothetical protein
MREDTILSLETTARYRPENPYQPAGSGAGGKLRHPIWQKPSSKPGVSVVFTVSQDTYQYLGHGKL